MSITIGNYDFSGPFKSTSSLEDKGGIYAILTPSTANNYKVLDVGESGNVKSRVENHDRKSCWERNANSGGLSYAVYYTPGMTESERQKIEHEIREKSKPTCGEQ